MDDKIDHVETENLILSNIPVKGKAEVGQRTFDPCGRIWVLRFQEAGLFQGCDIDLR